MKQAWVQIIPWDKELAIAALEAGADALVLAPGDTAKARELGRVTTVAEDGDLIPGRDVIVMEIKSKEDEARAARVPTEAMLLLEMRDWTIIPLENLLARRDRLMVTVGSADEARTMLGVLEKGVHGVLIAGADPQAARAIIAQVHACAPPLELLTATVSRVEPSGMGDRVCIDTCSTMSQGEGMLVGNTSSAFFLVHAETQENPYVAARPFRVNASAVHAYLLRPDNQTSYLSDLRTGDTVMVVNSQGVTRPAHIGRCKTESRPMLLVFAEVEGREISVYLQNAETINLTRPDGTPISVSRLQPGDQVLVKLETGGRHFGMAIDEKLQEN
ncbi:MAG: 3-dehydroquinate synthase II [Kiritimatiellia bacterium]|nr:3-dehydroquinate synthase II [Lentisphaerota bacterium]